MSFRLAKRSEAKPLIGIYSESGCGKTFSSLLLAKGFCGDMSQVGMIETEAGRGEAFADDSIIGGYNVRSIRAEFPPSEYGRAISEAEKAGFKALLIDSASHEWEGAGGVLSMAADNQANGKKGPLVWQKPKMDHQREFMLRLMQTPIPLVIVCMRAKYPMKEVVRDGKKEWMRSEVVEPKQSEDILYEMFIHGWIDHEHRFHGTKFTRPDLRKVFIENEPITIETGQRLAAWAAGSPKAAAPADDRKQNSAVAASTQPPKEASPELERRQSAADYITPDEALALEARCTENNIPLGKVKARFNVERLSQLTPEQLVEAHERIDETLAKRKAAA